MCCTALLSLVPSHLLPDCETFCDELRDLTLFRRIGSASCRVATPVAAGSHMLLAPVANAAPSGEYLSRRFLTEVIDERSLLRLGQTAEEPDH